MSQDTTFSNINKKKRYPGNHIPVWTSLSLMKYKWLAPPWFKWTALLLGLVVLPYSSYFSMSYIYDHRNRENFPRGSAKLCPYS